MITIASQKLGIDVGRLELVLPFQPPLIKLINISDKGCNVWSKLLKKANNNNQSLQNRERKWEDELQAIQRNNFWDRLYAMNKELFYNNRLKWFQYQIVRGTLKTNRLVSKFVPTITEKCTFCELQTENISHLFYDCNITSQFLDHVFGQFSQYWVEINGKPTKKGFKFWREI